VHRAPRTFSVPSSSSKFSCFPCTARMFAMFSRQFWFLLDALSGFRSLEWSFSGQRCFPAIRVRALVPRIVFFRPAVPCSYPNLGFGPSNRLRRASSAVKLFESRLWPLELSFSGLRCLIVTRTWALALRIVFVGLAVPSNYSRPGFGPSNCLFRASSASKLFEAGFRPLELYSSGQQRLQVIQDI
jgi:hypothetical protein